MPDTKHLLLMLATSQPPHPVEEIDWHEQRCALTGKLLSLRPMLFGRLTRGESIIAFYGDSTLNNRYLGRALFAGSARINEPRGRELLAGIPLYANGNRPSGAKTVIDLTDVRVAKDGEQLEDLKASCLTLSLFL